MACCTIPLNQKRALDFDLPKSKRRRCGTMYTIQSVKPSSTATASSTTTTEQPVLIDAKAKTISPFQLCNERHKLNNDQLLQHIRDEAKRFIKRKQLHVPLSPSSSSTIDKQHSSLNKDLTKSNDTPLFTITQVNLICDKMVKEREEYLREQYDTILNQKLNEQYDAFVKFTHEQIQKQFEKSQFTYVS